MNFSTFKRFSHWNNDVNKKVHIKYYLLNKKSKYFWINRNSFLILETKTAEPIEKKKYMPYLYFKKNRKKCISLVSHFFSTSNNFLYTLTKNESRNEDKDKIQNVKENVFQTEISNTAEKSLLTNQQDKIIEREYNEKTKKNENPNDIKIETLDKTKTEKKKWTKLRIFYYSINTLFFSYVFYKVYKNDMNLSKAEESITADFVKLFYNFEEKPSLSNSQFLTCLSEQLNKQIAMYFMQIDTEKSSGFLRNDAINFLSELNIKEDNEIIQKFIKSGIGKQYELKKISGCSLQEFAELIENVILKNKTKNFKDVPIKPLSYETTKEFYLTLLQYYLDTFIYYYKTSPLYLFFQKRKNKELEAQSEKNDNLENKILEKLIEYNKQYVEENNLPLIYLLNEDEIKKNRTILFTEETEKEILLIEKKKIEEKIQFLNKLQLKKKLNETELQRLNNLKLQLKNTKKAIWKEKMKKYFIL